MSEPVSSRFITSALRTVKMEADAVAELERRIDSTFAAACELLLATPGRVIVTGMGKSGHIANKVAATLASTGTPSFYVHPGEASHGDLGMITAQDVVIGLSYSGETAELMTLIPIIKRQNVPLIAMSGRPQSSLAEEADVHLNIAVAKEACPLNLAPTASSTAMLAMGDALAVALLDARGFTAEDFARSHPGGSLGRRLLVHVKDVMHSGEELPQVQSGAPLAQALLEVTRKGMGMTAVVNPQQQVVGIFTDGDLRRLLVSGSDLAKVTVAEVATAQPLTIGPDVLMADAEARMLEARVQCLVVVDAAGGVAGVIQIYE